MHVSKYKSFKRTVFPKTFRIPQPDSPGRIAFAMFSVHTHKHVCVCLLSSSLSRNLSDYLFLALDHLLVLIQLCLCTQRHIICQNNTGQIHFALLLTCSFFSTKSFSFFKFSNDWLFWQKINE